MQQAYPFDLIANRQRNVIQRLFSRLKRLRGIATRFAKTAAIRAGIQLFATLDTLNRLSHTTQLHVIGAPKEGDYAPPLYSTARLSAV